MTQHHPSAIIEKGALIDEGVKIGSYAFVGKAVQIKKGCEICHHATVDGSTKLGENNSIHPYALIGGRSQALNSDDQGTHLIIGNNNCFREYVTVNMAMHRGNATKIGDNNLLMTGVHIAHDCIIGNYNSIANDTGISGHAIIHNHCVISGQVGIPQNKSVGSYAFVTGKCVLRTNLPPFMIIRDHSKLPVNINRIGLERNGFSKEEIAIASSIYKNVYIEKTPLNEFLKTLKESDEKNSRPAKLFIDFFENLPNKKEND